MTHFEQILLSEVSSLPEARRADVLAFIRFLKLSLSHEELQLEQRFDEALKSIRARAQQMNITQEDIEEEIRAVRDEHAHRG